MWQLDCKESGTSKNWCFWTVVLGKTLQTVSWTARRSNQSILKEISSGCSLEGLMLKLKPQYFGHLMWSANSLEKTWFWKRLKAGGGGDDRGWDSCMASPTQWTWVWVDSGSWWWTGKAWCAVGHGVAKSRTGLNWTELFGGSQFNSW